MQKNDDGGFVVGMMIVLAIVSLVGSLIEKGRQQSAQAAESVSSTMLLAVAQEAIAPYVSAAVEAKPLYEAEAELVDAEEALGGDLTPADRRIVLMLGEFDAWLQALDSGNLRLGTKDLQGDLAGLAGDARDEGATFEEINERLIKFAQVAKKMKLANADLEWLETEVAVQRNLAAAKQ